MNSAISSTAGGKFRQTIRIGRHELTADEKPPVGGEDAGPEPHEWLLAGLAACTSMTVKMYADRKGWPLEGVEVTVGGERRDGAFVFRRTIVLRGALSEEQRAHALEIANKCPVHKTLTGTIQIETELAPVTTLTP
jgi:putative redox protein